MLGYREDPRHTIVVHHNTIFLTILALLLCSLIYYLQGILILLFAAFILMVALNPLVTKLQRSLKIPRTTCITLVYLLIMLFVVLVIGLLIPPLARELQPFLKTISLPLPQDQLGNLSFNFAELNAFANSIGSSLQVAIGLIASTFNSMFTFLTLLVMSFYLLLDRNNLHKKIAWFTQKATHVEKARLFIDELEHQLGGWVRAQMILMIIMAVVTYIALTILGVPFALPLALLAGILEILPNLGPTLSAIPAVFIAAVKLNPTIAITLVVFFIIIQQIENNFLVPKVMKENADVNPLVGIVAILAGFKLFSVVGGLLAIPIYIVLRACYSLWKATVKTE
jgi:predicted PurR-regulated permease PerM